MSLPYTVNPMPHTVDIRCPACGGHASFEFAEVVRIRERKDIAFFQESPRFEYHAFTDSCGHKWHAAIFIARLHGGSTDIIRDLPDGYDATDWEHSKYLYPKRHPSLGGYACHDCHSVTRHVLSWPDDAFYKIDYRGEVLWAFHQESAIDLLSYLSSALRDVSQYRWSSFLMKVPKEFQSAKARGTVTKRLAALLPKHAQKG